MKTYYSVEFIDDQIKGYYRFDSAQERANWIKLNSNVTIVKEYEIKMTLAEAAAFEEAFRQ